MRFADTITLYQMGLLSERLGFQLSSLQSVGILEEGRILEYRFHVPDSRYVKIIKGQRAAAMEEGEALFLTLATGMREEGVSDEREDRSLGMQIPASIQQLRDPWVSLHKFFKREGSEEGCLLSAMVYLESRRMRVSLENANTGQRGGKELSASFTDKGWVTEAFSREGGEKREIKASVDQDPKRCAVEMEGEGLRLYTPRPSRFRYGFIFEAFELAEDLYLGMKTPEGTRRVADFGLEAFRNG